MVTTPKKQPARSCIACGVTTNKRQLVRFVRNARGEVSCDGSGKAPGRGAYLCGTAECFATAQKKNRLSRALKCNLNDDDYQRLQTEFSQLCATGNV